MSIRKMEIDKNKYTNQTKFIRKILQKNYGFEQKNYGFEHKILHNITKNKPKINPPSPKK